MGQPFFTAPLSGGKGSWLELGLYYKNEVEFDIKLSHILQKLS